MPATDDHDIPYLGTGTKPRDWPAFTEDHAEAVDAALTAVAGTVVTDHGALAGKDDDDHPQYLTEARHDADDHSALEFPVQVVAAVKTTDESVTSSTTLQDDNELTVAVEANTTYRLSAEVMASAASIDPDFKWGWSVPAGATMTWWYVVYDDEPATPAAVLDETDSATNGWTTNATLLRIFGVVEVGATAGAVTFQWAQNVSDANAMTVHAGSVLDLAKVS